MHGRVGKPDRHPLKDEKGTGMTALCSPQCRFRALLSPGGGVGCTVFRLNDCVFNCMYSMRNIIIWIEGYFEGEKQ